MVQGLGFRVLGLRFRVQGLGLRVLGLRSQQEVRGQSKLHKLTTTTFCTPKPPSVVRSSHRGIF